jgi:hypothetical protein
MEITDGKMILNHVKINRMTFKVKIAIKTTTISNQETKINKLNRIVLNNFEFDTNLLFFYYFLA